jgi:hypothetical protein
MSPRWGNQSKLYEKITLHFGQRRASRSVRTKNRRCRSGEFACACEDGKEHHDRESAGNDGEDQGNKHDDEHQHDDGFDSKYVELEQHDNHDDFEPEPIV